MIDTQTLIKKLNTFSYKFKKEEENVKIYLSYLCYLKISFVKDKVKFSSRIRYGFHFLSLELNFFIYGLAFYVISSNYWATINKGIIILFALFITHFVICFIKTESLKIIIHNWSDLEENTQKQGDKSS
jgi:hypothetical protein